MILGQILLLCCQLLLPCSLLPSTPAHAATTPVTSQSRPGSSATTGPSRQVSGVRLADGNQPSEGRLEVLIDGGWGTVCDEDFGVAEAKVACTMLGYPGYPPKVKTSPSYSEGSGSIAMDLQVSCVGNETSLSQCQYRSQHSCSHSQDVGIQCSPPVAKIRLAGGSTVFEGRVEVRLPGIDEWGTVCDNGFDIKDARVVCRMLGELRYTIQPNVKTGAYYGRGNGIDG
ncbi:scavenger receptor cysteine-rich domain superfamily protein-like [Littorina saxatilis]